MPASDTDPLLPKHPAIPKRSPSSESVDRHSAHSQLNDRNRRDSEDENEGSQDEEDEPLRPESFYELIGMMAPDPQGRSPSNLEAAHGFYNQLCQHKRTVERKYRLYDIMIMVFLVMQIVLSAVFIVLGALNIDEHIAIAVLGAVSSVIAGVLALIRGQGLPNRLRMERDGLKKVILEADELYWDVTAGREVTFEDVKKIRDAYSTVLEDSRRNHPVSPTKTNMT